MLDEIKVRDEKETLTAGRLRDVLIGSFDWSQGNPELQENILGYIGAKHPDWKQRIPTVKQLAKDEYLTARIKRRLAGSLHDEIPKAEDEIPHNVRLVANYTVNAFAGKNTLDEALSRCLNQLIARDLRFGGGRPEKEGKSRPDQGHGRKFESYICDFILSGIPYPGDPVYTEFARDMLSYLTRTQLSDTVKEEIRHIVIVHNEWSAEGKAPYFVDIQSFNFLKI